MSGLRWALAALHPGGWRDAGATVIRSAGLRRGECGPKKARSERLLTLNEEHSRLFRQQFLGQTVQVLLEGRKHERWEGLTDNYLRVEIVDLPHADTHNWQNTLVTAHLSHLVDDGIAATLMEQPALSTETRS